jgi:hypothetical protein
MNTKVPQLVIKTPHLVRGQLKALRLLSTEFHGEDDRASSADILHRCNGITEIGERASWKC